ncbi:hypothetical protein CYMTET_38889, partial [Cymbomonas tetramitiformis]
PEISCRPNLDTAAETLPKEAPAAAETPYTSKLDVLRKQLGISDPSPGSRRRSVSFAPEIMVKPEKAATVNVKAAAEPEKEKIEGTAELTKEKKEATAELAKEKKEATAELAKEKKEATADLTKVKKEATAELAKEKKEATAELTRDTTAGPSSASKLDQLKKQLGIAERPHTASPKRRHVESKPEEAKPQAKPQEAKPEEAKPEEAKPQAKPEEAKGERTTQGEASSTVKTTPVETEETTEKPSLQPSGLMTRPSVQPPGVAGRPPSEAASSSQAQTPSDIVQHSTSQAALKERETKNKRRRSALPFLDSGMPDDSVEIADDAESDSSSTSELPEPQSLGTRARTHAVMYSARPGELAAMPPTRPFAASLQRSQAMSRAETKKMEEVVNLMQKKDKPKESMLNWAAAWTSKALKGNRKESAATPQQEMINAKMKHMQDMVNQLFEEVKEDKSGLLRTQNLRRMFNLKNMVNEMEDKYKNTRLQAGESKLNHTAWNEQIEELKSHLSSIESLLDENSSQNTEEKGPWERIQELREKDAARGREYARVGLDDENASSVVGFVSALMALKATPEFHNADDETRKKMVDGLITQEL